jgi:hypothetical protein
MLSTGAVSLSSSGPAMPHDEEAELLAREHLGTEFMGEEELARAIGARVLEGLGAGPPADRTADSSHRNVSTQAQTI